MSDLSALSASAWEALFRAQVTVLRQLSREFPSGELSLNEYDVLFNLSRQEGRRARIRDLNRSLLLTQPSVSRMIDRLAARDLVSKQPDPGDGRGTIVELTEQGLALFRRVAVSHVASIRRHVGAALSEEELEQLIELADRLRHSVDGGGPAPRTAPQPK